jgi:hypothetical protein
MDLAEFARQTALVPGFQLGFRFRCQYKNQMNDIRMG